VPRHCAIFRNAAVDMNRSALHEDASIDLVNHPAKRSRLRSQGGRRPGYLLAGRPGGRAAQSEAAPRVHPGRRTARTNECRGIRSRQSEPSANELVQPDATRRHVASCLARSEPNPQRRQILDDFSFDEREISTHSAIVRVMPATEGIPIARQSLTDVCPDSKYRSHRRALNGRYVDRLDSACKRRPRADAIAGLGVLAHRVLETDGRRQRPRVDKTTAR
jgi:hypothetical protein